MDFVPEAVSRYFLTYGYLALFLLFTISEAGIPMPFPNYLMVIFASYLAFDSKANIPLILVSTVAGMALGASLLYLLSLKGGYPLLKRFGKFIKLYPERIAKVEQWFQRRGTLAIFVGRISPGVRIQTAIAGGIFRIPYRRSFLPATIVASAIQTGFYIGIGALVYRGHESIYNNLKQYQLYAGIAIGCAIVLVIIGFLIWRRLRASRRRLTP